MIVPALQPRNVDEAIVLDEISRVVVAKKKSRRRPLRNDFTAPVQEPSVGVPKIMLQQKGRANDR